MRVRVPQRIPLKSLYIRAIVYTVAGLIGIYQLTRIEKSCNIALMIRSGHHDFLPDPKIVPDEFEQWQYRIKVVYTKWHHTNMTDSGPFLVKREIAREVNKFLDENEGCE